jgi:hypothetical protein
MLAFAAMMGIGTKSVEARLVYGNLSNFDLHNFTGGPVNDMELILQGNNLTCADIVDYYDGWGTSAGQPRGGCQQVAPGIIKITWSDPGSIPHCQYRHFGVRLRTIAPSIRVQQATWTNNGVPTGTLAMIWQTWVGTADCPVGDIIWPPIDPVPSPNGPPWIISRSWAFSSRIIPLDDLDRSNPYLDSLDWSVPEQDVLNTLPDTLWTDAIAPPLGAVVVKYSVVNGSGDTLGYYINEAPVTNDVPSLTGYGMIVLAVALLVTAIWVVRKRRAGITTV